MLHHCAESNAHVAHESLIWNVIHQQIVVFLFFVGTSTRSAEIIARITGHDDQNPNGIACLFCN